MGADFSRIRLDPLLDYAGVELAQGRVLVDADMNELTGIIDRRLRALSSDVLGRARVSSNTADAFRISVAAGTLQIGKGRLYVDGLLAENHGSAKLVFNDLLAESEFVDAISYTAQRYLPDPPALPRAGRHLIYLDVWDREVTHLEKSDLIESAVGVDATSRVQTVWQVRALAEDAGTTTTCATADTDIPGWSAKIAPSTGVLTTGTFDAPADEDPFCELPPTGGYRGLENQLYRVEIHDPGQPGEGATFKWSRENASVGSRVARIISGTELELQTLGRDDVLRLNKGDWVEITDDVREFSQRPGEMRRVTVDDTTRRIQFRPALPETMLPAAFPDSDLPVKQNLRVRRWDQSKKIFRIDPSGTPVEFQNLDDARSTGLIKVPADTTLILEHGVTVSFDGRFRTGDYWVFAARTADASVEPLDRAPPRGIHHHFARLGIWDVAAGTVTDCRNSWPPQTEGHDCSCTACVTAESHASGQFTIQDAVNQVRETGGTICLGPGEYAVAKPVRMVGARSVRIRGQGASTIVAGPGGVFAVQDCLAIAIEDLAIVSLGHEAAVSIRTAIGLSLRQLVITIVGADARGSAIALQGVLAAASISKSAISARIGIMANDPVAAPPVGEDQGEPFLLASALAIEDNKLSCERKAIELSDSVVHAMSTRITRNEVFGCAEVAISMLGLGTPASSTVISANTFSITGNGIRCGLGGAWIEGNKIVNSPTERPDRNEGTIGIALVAGFDRNGVDQCHILSNQVSGFTSTGIEIDAPARELIIKLNTIESCGNGIVVTAALDSTSVAIENNLLRDIGPARHDSDVMVIGIGVIRADSAVITGNIIRKLGMQAKVSPLRAGIFTLGVMRPLVNGNDVSEVAPTDEFFGESAGIMLRAPYTQFEVTHNRVQRDTKLPPPDPRYQWFALAVADFDRSKAVLRLGKLAAVLVDNSVLVLNGASAGVWTPSDDAFRARGSVLGNVLTARGGVPAVEISAKGECLFNDNRVESVSNHDRPAVRLRTEIAIVHANRVRGGHPSVELHVNRAVVLGNITEDAIDGWTPRPPSTAQPMAAWDHLNIQA